MSAALQAALDELVKRREEMDAAIRAIERLIQIDRPLPDRSSTPPIARKIPIEIRRERAVAPAPLPNPPQIRSEKEKSPLAKAERNGATREVASRIPDRRGAAVPKVSDDDVRVLHVRYAAGADAHELAAECGLKYVSLISRFAALGLARRPRGGARPTLGSGLAPAVKVTVLPPGASRKPEGIQPIKKRGRARRDPLDELDDDYIPGLDD